MAVCTHTDPRPAHPKSIRIQLHTPSTPTYTYTPSTALGAAHAAAAPMLAAGVPATLAALLLTGAVCGVLWAIALTLRAFRQAFDARELLFDDGSGGGLRTRSSYQFHRRQGGPSGRWMTGYCGPNGELPMFPEDVHLQCSHWAETVGLELGFGGWGWSWRLLCV